VLSESAGGLLDEDNLRPVCASCNTSMGSRHMAEYMLKFYPKVLEQRKKQKQI
jgi:hypothetical protein